MKALCSLLLAMVAVLAFGEGEATWSARPERTDVRAGEVVRIVISAALKTGWHTYSIVPVQDGPFPTTIDPPKGTGIEAAGPVTEKAPHKQFDPNFQKEVGQFEGSAEFYAPVKVTSGAKSASVHLKYMVCNAQNCLPPKDVELTVPIALQPGEPRAEFTTSTSPRPTTGTATEVSKREQEGLWSFIVFAFIAGLATLLTPCVFPMIPVTVSYFSKQQGDDGKVHLSGPVAYCLGIIGTFTLLGVLLGFSGLNTVATNVWVNLGLAILFIVLAASLFGVFELTLPGWLVNKASTKSRTGGIVGAVFMGLTFTLTSFTCSVPVVGLLLGGSVTGGAMYPVIGMLAFSTAFALPFFLLALFPSALSRLPRSGAWMVTVKAFMGFLELMAALKFLSNADLAFSLGWLTRPVFLAIWAALAALAGVHLLGWIRLPHDADAKPGWMRRGFAVVSLAGAVWFLAAMNGFTLGKLAGFMPPDPYPFLNRAPVVAEGGWHPSFEEALAEAKTSGKNVFIDFTGVYCTNCRAIEETVFTNAKVKDAFKSFVLAKLFTDRGTESDKANQALQKRFTGTEALPIYVVVSPEGKVLKIHEQQVPLEDVDQFLNAIRPFTARSVVAWNAGD